MRKHLAIFGEHYRQRITELSVIAYAEDLSGLTADQLDAACRRARQTSEFMPVSAAILKAHEDINTSHREGYLGVPLLEYQPITQAERMSADLDDRILAMAERIKASRLDTPENRYRKWMAEYSRRTAAGENPDQVRAAMGPVN